MSRSARLAEQGKSRQPEGETLMRNRSSIKVVGLPLSVLFVVSYVLMCVSCAIFTGLGFVVGSAMLGGVLEAAYPGFGWSVTGFIIGLLWSVIAAFYVAVVFVPVYNYLQHRETTTREARYVTCRSCT
jgi:phosphotransferase system  glucose/maltose/N-acetylglucosamine-specific IIC component